MKLKNILNESTKTNSFSELAYIALAMLQKRDRKATITKIAEVFRSMDMKSSYDGFKDNFGFKEYVEQHGLDRVNTEIKSWWYNDYKMNKDYKRFPKYTTFEERRV